MRGWFQEEAKICGHYVLDKENPIQLQLKAEALLRAVDRAMLEEPNQDRQAVMVKMAEIATRIEAEEDFQTSSYLILL